MPHLEKYLWQFCNFYRDTCFFRIISSFDYKSCKWNTTLKSISLCGWVWTHVCRLLCCIYVCKCVFICMPMPVQARGLPLGISVFLFLELAFSLKCKYKLARLPRKQTPTISLSWCTRGDIFMVMFLFHSSAFSLIGDFNILTCEVLMNEGRLDAFLTCFVSVLELSISLPSLIPSLVLSCFLRRWIVWPSSFISS